MKKFFVVCAVLVMMSPSFLFSAGTNNFIFMGSTIGPVDSGIIEVLENAFEEETGIRVRHIGAGTGAALDIARKGNLDLVIVHAKSLEERFIAEGYGTERIPLMYNDFVIVGPQSDPAGIRGEKKVRTALKKIHDKAALFVTRGDNSGTHVAEMVLWKDAGIQPSGTWYHKYEKGTEGNAPTLRFADQKNAYTVIDRATYLSLKNSIKLAILVEGDEILLNYISVIPVSAKKFPRVNEEDTKTFVRWLASVEKGQKIISNFGKDKYGSPLFFPNSKECKEKAKAK